MPLSLFGGDIDYWRNSSLRYLGYANEVGEAFRHQAPAAVKPSYGLALCYVCCDAVDKYTRATAQAAASSARAAGSDASCSPAAAALDCFVWQVLASVAIPGATINLIVRGARAAVPALGAGLPAAAREWIPTTLGLAAIPAIIHPIDAAVDGAMDLGRPSLGLPTSDAAPKH